MTLTESRIPYTEFPIQADNFLEDILKGLMSERKTLPSKYFYDKKGSELFEEITHTEEYYPTRTEISLLEASQMEIAELIGENAALIELGSGSSRKIKLLLSSLKKVGMYIPVDISKEYLLSSAEKLSQDFPALTIHAVNADYTSHFSLPEASGRKRVLFFPGSTIGNFEPDEAKAFLQSISSLMKKGDGFLIGVDMKKDPLILHAAYNDRQGITKKFNLNMLHHINRELGADFQAGCFSHRAFYNEKDGRIEMHLDSMKKQEVIIAGKRISFEKGESIMTECSYKYSPSEFQELSLKSGWTPQKVWIDESHLFSLHYLTK